MLREKLKYDLKTAMKAKNSCGTATLRLILAALKDRDIASRTDNSAPEPSTDEDNIQIRQMMTKMIKQRRESAHLYRDGGRVDLADRETAEIEIIKDYLPSEMSETEMAEAVRATIDKLGSHCIKDMGRTMATLKAAYAGRMDFSKASNIVKEYLTSE